MSYSSIYSGNKKNKPKAIEIFRKGGFKALKDAGYSSPLPLDDVVINNHKMEMYCKYGINTLPPHAIYVTQVFSDGSYLFYGVGNIDCWCVYFWSVNNRYHKDKETKKIDYKTGSAVPLDIDYFSNLLYTAETYFNKKDIFRDFVDIYNLAGQHGLSDKVFSSIYAIVGKRCYYSYNEVSLKLIQDFCIIYMALVSEIKRDGAKLKQRIKMLGMFQIFILNEPVETAVNYSKGKTADKLEEECRNYGF
jgi:hypothetical protein